jgi:hypothetical protein
VALAARRAPRTTTRRTGFLSILDRIVGILRLLVLPPAKLWDKCLKKRCLPRLAPRPPTCPSGCLLGRRTHAKLRCVTPGRPIKGANMRGKSRIGLCKSSCSKRVAARTAHRIGAAHADSSMHGRVMEALSERRRCFGSADHWPKNLNARVTKLTDFVLPWRSPSARKCPARYSFRFSFLLPFLSTARRARRTGAA